MDGKTHPVNSLTAERPASLLLGDTPKDTSDLVILSFKHYYAWNFQEIVGIPIRKKPVKSWPGKSDNSSEKKDVIVNTGFNWYRKAKNIISVDHCGFGEQSLESLLNTLDIILWGDCNVGSER